MSNAEPFNFDALQDQIKFDDPQPGKKATASRVTNTRVKPPGANPVGRPSKDKAINDMAEEMQGLMMLAMMPLKLRDIHDYESMSSCADMFITYDPKKNEIVATPELIAWSKAFAKVGIDNKYIRKFFESTDGVSNWLGLAMATQPFIVGFASHHGMPKMIGRRSARSGNDQME